MSVSREGEFFVYCIEIYKAEKEMTGRTVMRLFRKYRVYDYVRSCYEALHTTGPKYIVNDIDEYIDRRREAS